MTFLTITINAIASLFVNGFVIFVFQKAITNWFERRLEIALSNHKAQNDKKIYVSKVKFDSEFEMYKELSKSCFSLVLSVSPLFPIMSRTPEDTEERKQHEYKLYNQANTSIIELQEQIFSYAPFISEEVYVTLEELRMLCKDSIEYYWDSKIHNIRPYNPTEHLKYAEKNHEIQTLHKRFINLLRTRLESLEVIS